MMPKRDKRLYSKIMHSKGKKEKEVNNLKRKKSDLSGPAKKGKTA